MIDWTKPIETEEGFPARVLATDLPGELPIAIAWLPSKHALRWHSESFSESAANRAFRNGPNKREGWINIFAPETPGSVYVAYAAEVWPSQEVADHMNGRHGRRERIACIRIEWEEPPHA